MLKQEYDLLVLKIWQETKAERSLVKGADRSSSSYRRVVHFSLEGKVDGTLQTLLELGRYDLRELAPQSLKGRRVNEDLLYEMQIPESVTGPLGAWIEENDETDRPLWVHLVKPYGALGILPWEYLMQETLGVPILRLPDFFRQPPTERSTTLDVVICGSKPVAKGPVPVYWIVRRLVEVIAEATAEARYARIHIFVDEETFHMLKQEWDLGQEAETCRWTFRKGLDVILYAPAEAEIYSIPEGTTRIGTTGERLENPWLRWMRDALKGRSVDMVHFIGHGYRSRDRGALALAESPLVNEDRRVARFVGPQEIKAFLEQMGAWGILITAPEENYSPFGLRSVTDVLSLSRPGTVVLHELQYDPDFAAIHGVYRFLTHPPPQVPPASKALVMCTEPFRTAIREDAASRFRGAEFKKLITEPTREVGTPPTEPEEEKVPSWVSSMERILDSNEQDLHHIYVQQVKKKSSPERTPESTGSSSASAFDVKQKVLRELEEMAAKLATKYIDPNLKNKL